MELTSLTDYGVRVLMYTGVHADRRVTLREIASAYDISLEHLRKVVHRLAQVGYLETSRGRAGGMTLAREPAEIRIGEVVLALEHSLSIIDCERQPCPLCGGCSLKHALDDARGAFIERLNHYTLADLLGQQQTYQRLQAIEPAL